MFKMIGGDGQEYGPATAEEIRGWIKEHRANGQTQVRADGDSEWRPLESVPEFADDLREAYPGAIPPAPTGPGPEAGASASAGWDQGMGSGARAEFVVGDCLGRGWMLLSRHFFLVIGACLTVWLILTLTALATCVGGLFSLVLTGALQGGLYLVLLRLIRGEPASLGDVFACFGPRFLPLMLIAIVTQILSQLGLLFCVVPGLVLKVLWAFALPLAVDRGYAFWPAMELSRRTVMPHFFKVAGLMLVAFLPLLVFEVYSIARAAWFFTELLGPGGILSLDLLQSKRTEIVTFLTTLGLQEQLVVLLTMPFAYAALMHAYEILFGKSSPRYDR